MILEFCSRTSILVLIRYFISTLKKNRFHLSLLSLKKIEAQKQVGFVFKIISFGFRIAFF